MTAIDVFAWTNATLSTQPGRHRRARIQGDLVTLHRPTDQRRERGPDDSTSSPDTLVATAQNGIIERYTNGA